MSTVDPLNAATATAFSGLYAQSVRMKVVSENLANAETTGTTPGADPYRRKTVTFTSVLDGFTNSNLVAVDASGTDPSDFRVEHMPGNPAADANGDVKLPNVNSLVEMTDMRQALRSYEANLQVIKQGRQMSAGLVDLLRSSG